MRTLDRYLRDVRIGKAERFMRDGDVVVDVGCADGAMFERWRGRIGYGHGVDPALERESRTDGYTLHPGRFPEALPAGIECDLITMLAVLEHIPAERQGELAAAAERLLKPGGRLVLTVPSPRVDEILALLTRLRLVDGMSVEEHYGFDPARTPAIFSPPLRLLERRRFQLGLNNLFAFEKPA
jgi:SAM-dependent methyltransferase